MASIAPAHAPHLNSSPTPMPKAPGRHSYGQTGTDLTGVFGSSVRAKKKIRSIETLLQREDLPADVRIEKERALKALQVDLRNTQFRLKTQKRAKKYHMVRFFERKKAVRKLKQAKKSFDAATEEGVKKDIKKARKVLLHAQVDVAYVYLFPKSEKYISLYPTGPLSAEVEDANVKKGMQLTEERRNQFKKKVEGIIAEEKLPFTFEDILSGATIDVDTIALSSSRTEEIDAPQNEAEEEDDFFE